MNRRRTNTASFFAFSLLCIASLLPVACGKKDAGSAGQPGASITPSPPDSAQRPAGDRARLVERNNHGVGLMGMFKYDEARAIFDEIAREFPDELDVKVNLAIAMLNRQHEGDEAAALTMLGEVLESDPDHPRANYCAGLLRWYLGETDAACQHFTRVAERDAHDAYVTYFLAQCLEQRGELEQAAATYNRVIAQDPYLRSAYLRLGQVSQRLGREADAARTSQEFTRLENNPRAKVFKFIYTRMGPKGEAMALDAGAQPDAPVPLPPGPLFADPRPLLADDGGATWLAPPNERPASMTAVDLDRDGDIDVFIANVLDEPDGVKNAVCINHGDGSFALDREHILAMIPGINAALWGDYDNDGLVDVYLCRSGPNMLWRQRPSDPAADQSTTQWEDVTAPTMTANGELDTVDGALFDADHDGDLDIFCVNADGPNELLNNNSDGTFRGIAREAGIAGDGRGSRQVLPVDLDGDRDLDIIVINELPPHDVYMNDRLWAYREPEAAPPLTQQAVGGIVAVDCEANGELAFPTCLPDLRARQVAIADVDGDGRFEEVRSRSSGHAARNVDSLSIWKCGARNITLVLGDHLNIISWSPINIDIAEGPAIIAALNSSGPIVWAPGPGRHKFAALRFTGREVISDNRQLRSNASGIGVHVAVRIDSMWSMLGTIRDHSGPGQSLQPHAIGLGGHDHIDFVAITWPDGVFQSEVHGVPPVPPDESGMLSQPARDFSAGTSELIEEMERQVSSCPILFAWNGTKYEFVTDLLGVGGIGYMVAPGSYAPSRPWENVLLPVDLLQPHDDTYELKLAEPMEEVCYLDAATLVAYDLPPGWSMTLDERMGINDPQPTGAAQFYRHGVLPTRAMNDRGEEVTASIRHADLVAAPPGELDHRFIGRLAREHVLTMEFDDMPRGDSLILIIDGWIEYPYSQTMFGAWQAGATFDAPTLEARGEDGQWRVILEQFGYPAGMPRQMSVPIPIESLPAGTRQLRLRTNQEIYVDRVMLAVNEPCEQVLRRALSLGSADLMRSGFARRTTGPQRQPYYDDDLHSPFWDTRHQRGTYTEFGDCTDLVASRDGAVAIFGPGEEVVMRFAAGAAHLPPLQPGWTRRFVLEARGWCKDMDLFTRDGDTVEPLPGQPSSVRDELHRRFNTRFESGIAADGR